MDKTFIDPNNDQGNKNQNTNDQTRVENNGEQTPKDENQNRIVLNNVTKSQKEKILALGGSGLIGAIGGAGAFAFLSFVDNAANPVPPEPTPVEPDPVDPIEPEPVIIYTEAPFAHNINDDMSFGDAFGAARAEVGPGGFFEWHGNTYNTYYKEEWELLSPDERDEFLASVDNFDTDDVDVETDVAIDDIGTDQPGENHPIDDVVETEIAQENTENITEPDHIVITDSDYIETADLDGDGYVDAALVDADGNDMPDVVVDLDADGNMDVLILDVDPETGITGYEEMVYLDDTDATDDGYASRDEVDDFDDADINPDIDIDNDYNMTDMA